MTIKIWEGRKGARCGCDHSDFQIIEFNGQELGWWQSSDDRDNRGTDVSVFQTDDGQIVIHRVNWSRWANEDTYGTIMTYDNIEAAIKDGWRNVLENVGVIPRRVRSLREWRAERERQQEAD